MSTKGSLYSKLVPQLTALRKSAGGWSNRGFRESISQTEKSIQQGKGQKDGSDVAALLTPFFEAVKIEAPKTQPIIVETMLIILEAIGEDKNRDFNFIARVLGALFISAKQISDELRVNSCLTIYKFLESSVGWYYVHSTLLHNVFIFYLEQHDLLTPENKQSREMIRKIVVKAVNLYIERFEKPIPMPEYNSIPKIASYLSKMICKNALSIQEYAYSRPESTINDVNMIVMIQSFTKSIANHKYKAPTTFLACQILVSIMDSSSPFLQSPHFITLLRTDIHVTLLSLAYDSQLNLSEATANLISLVWQKYAPEYLEGLNELLDKGLATALASPIPATIVKAFKVFSSLVANPQFLVDAFVNYDCDHSGLFKNIYENSVNLVVKRAYPEQQATDLHKIALSTLIKILENLWKYFKSFDNTKQEKDEAEVILGAKKSKDILDQAQVIFKKSPSKGLAFFAEHGLCNNDPESYANFLFDTPSLDPASVGEIIGGSKELHLAILPLFIKRFDFRGLSFEQAFRQFLSKFQIPGESQMIDRVMEQFGTKFYNDNPTLFSCADTVYVLAFSTLMLHTDAHHPNVKARMTLDQFVANNKGIDGGKDLPFNFLENLYKGITSEKIFVSHNEIKASPLLTREQQRELYQEQTKQTLAIARKRTTTEIHSHQFHRAESPLLIGPMFHSIWGGVLAALTMSFEMSDDSEIVNYCLSGFQLCTHLASHCYVEDALNTLVDSFAKFTRLHTFSSELKQKNFLCTNALIQCAIEDRNFLKGAWTIILEEISALDKMKDNRDFITDTSSTHKLFSLTVTLDRESIIDFVGSLCVVSKKEIDENPPRLTMLLMVSDLAINNMGRPMFIWRDIWKILGDFFVSIGTSDDPIVAESTINILRQLALQFLSKEEMKNYHFQKDFLEPYSDIYEAQNNPKVKETILLFVQQIVCELAPVVHSGWEIILKIIHVTATEKHLKKIGFQILEIIVTRCANTIMETADKLTTTHLMNVISAFIMNDQVGEIAMQATAYFGLLAPFIAKENESDWITLLQTVIKCQHHQVLEIQESVQEILIQIVTNHGCSNDIFMPSIWHFFFTSTVMELFTPHAEMTQRTIKQKTNLLNTINTDILISYVSLIAPYAEDILNFLKMCCSIPNRMLRDTSLNILDKYVENNCELLQEEKLWNLLHESLKGFVDSMLNSVLFVKIITHFIKIYTDNKEISEQLLQILENVSDSCNNDKERGDEYLQCWCLARKNYFHRLNHLNRHEEMAEHFYQTLKYYYDMEQNNINLISWNDLVVVCLELITSTEENVFKIIFDRSTELICRLVEVDSVDIRNSLTNVLRKQFHIE